MDAGFHEKRLELNADQDTYILLVFLICKLRTIKPAILSRIVTEDVVMAQRVK